ncbi:unnamed protein product [Durusdinium trenchii]|uniref:Uncharacterized protein n=1 Tax=Durusdinium trenchii TaxID=1381693 RepID=A0ABP0HQV1_9DINO
MDALIFGSPPREVGDRVDVVADVLDSATDGCGLRILPFGIECAVPAVSVDFSPLSIRHLRANSHGHVLDLDLNDPLAMGFDVLDLTFDLGTQWIGQVLPQWGTWSEPDESELQLDTDELALYLDPRLGKEDRFTAIPGSFILGNLLRFLEYQILFS